MVGVGWKYSVNSLKPDFFEFVSPMIGLPLSHVWRGYGSALFIELGELHNVHYKKWESKPKSEWPDGCWNRMELAY